jgi:hypothetical protein
MRWSTTSAELLQRLRNSGSTSAVPRDEWPAFCAEVPGVVGVWGYPTTGPVTVRSEGTTLTGVVGALEMIRRDPAAPTSQRVKSYRYYLRQFEDGSVQRIGPFKDVPPRHWRADMPPWASTGT